MVATLLTWTVLLLGAAPDDALAPWAANRHPSDVAKRHVQEITEGQAEYVVVQGGTMDGRNCRSPQGVWQPFQQTWESNRSVRVENVGETDVVNPWLASGRNDFRSLDQIVARAIEPGMTDKEKARALWWQEVQHRFHLEGDNGELGDPVKVFNVYGYNTCGNDSIALAGQWRKAGLKVAPARLVGHCVTQVFYDNAWHLMDGDMHSIYLLRDNETVAGEQDLVRDHDLIRRTHTQGLLQAGESRGRRVGIVDLCVRREGHRRPQLGQHGLEPDAASVRGTGVALGAPEPGQVSRYPATPVPRADLQWTVGIPARLHRPRVRGGATARRVDPGAERTGSRRKKGRPGSSSGRCAVLTSWSGADWRSRGPAAKFALSWDGRSWHEVDRNLDGLFPPEGPARYVYYLRCQLSGDARLRRLGIINDLQMAPLTLPGMGVGANTFRYTDQAAGERRVRITHQWVERSASRPPGAPREPVIPPNLGSGRGDRRSSSSGGPRPIPTATRSPTTTSSSPRGPT